MAILEDLTEPEIQRYARHIVLREIGGEGQRRLKAARVLVVGAGGLGAPILLYLAAAGVGTIGVVDDDEVAISNLQRQVIFQTDDARAMKALVAAGRLRALNPEVTIVPHAVRLDRERVDALVAAYDVVADGSDNLPTRSLVEAACFRLGRTLISGAVQGVDGQLTTLKPHLGPPHPCWRCFNPTDVADRALPTCAASGVLGPAAGVVGTLQALEVVKEVLGIGRSLSGRLLLYDALGARFDEIVLTRNPGCASACATRGAEERTGRP